MFFSLIYLSILFMTIFLVSYNYFNPNFLENIYPPLNFPLPLLIRGKFAGSSFILMLAFFFPAIFFLILGIYKYMKDETLSFQEILSRSIQFRINREQLDAILKFIGFVSFFGILMIIPIIIGYSIQDVMNFIIDFFFIIFGFAGILVGVFIISTFGNFTVVFPLPYSFVLIAIGVNLSLHLPLPLFITFGFFIGIFAGLGAAIGETSAWLLGRSQSTSLEDSELGRKVFSLKQQIDKGYGGILVFVYAATPLPDDVLLIALGATKYKIWKAIIWCFLGKVILCFISVFLGAVPIVSQMFGGTEPNPFLETLWLIIGLGIVFLLIYFPYDEYIAWWKKKLGQIPNCEADETNIIEEEKK